MAHFNSVWVRTFFRVSACVGFFWAGLIGRSGLYTASCLVLMARRRTRTACSESMREAISQKTLIASMMDLESRRRGARIYQVGSMEVETFSPLCRPCFLFLSNTVLRHLWSLHSLKLVSASISFPIHPSTLQSSFELFFAAASAVNSNAAGTSFFGIYNSTNCKYGAAQKSLSENRASTSFFVLTW